MFKKPLSLSLSKTIFLRPKILHLHWVKRVDPREGFTWKYVANGFRTIDDVSLVESMYLVFTPIAG